MARVTIVDDERIDVAAEIVDGRVLVPRDGLADALGWTLKPEGLCRDDVCVPVRDRDALVAGERVDVVGAAAALGRPTVVDADLGIVAVALDRERRATALQSLVAPDVTLLDLDGEPHALSQWRGQKRLLHAFSSW
ncbi:MAG TPA: hypothetical protein VFW97_13600 [Acidimicrobiia bacterium]|nr:hypothetical protein [Acidimicrobiia bacterium]